MSIADAIVNAQNKVKAVYTKCEEKGATLPETQDLANLPATIDSMSSAEGNAVQAFALGEAKNAVAGDKVTLNFSANIPMGSEDFSLPAGKNQSGAYVGPVSAAYVDSEYIYYSAPGGVSYYFYAYNKKTGGRTEIGNISSLDYISQFGLAAPGGYLRQFVAGKMYTLDVPDHSFYANTSDGKITLVCTGSSYSHATGYSILMRDIEGFYSQMVSFHPDSVGFPVCLLDSEDGVNYPLVCRKKYTDELVTYNINTVTKTLDFVGSITKSVFADTYDDYPQCVSASLGDITFRFGDDSNFKYFYVFRAVKDENGVYDVEFLNDLRQQAIDYLTLMGLSDIYNCCGFVGNVLCLQKWGAVGGDGFIKVDPDNLTVTGYDFAPKASINYTGLYGNGYSIAYYGIKDGNHKYTVGFMQPIEQPYVATSPQTDRFFANQTLTGIVKENDNGILKVSTVEDPNNLPPAVPDEAGLKTEIKYGSAEGVNGKVSKGLSVSSDYSVSGFYSNAGAVVRTKNPFVDYSGTINSFEIVMPATMTASDSKYHMLGYLGKNSSGEMGLLVYYSGRWILRLKFEGESKYTDISGSSATLNTKTLVKVTYDSSTGYTLWLSTDDGSSWTNSGASTTKTSPINRVGDFVIGGESTSTDGWRGSIDFKGLYIKINDEEVYNGIGPVFGSVDVGYGYFRNTLTEPSDKYIAYDGGTITEDNIQGSKATTMNIVLGRAAEGGSWTSDTEGYLSAQETAVTGANKKLSTPVYLWHDLSYITPAVPETIEAEVVVRKNNAQVLQDFTTTGVTVDEQANITGFNSGAKYMAYTNSPLYNKSVSSINWWFSFTTGTSVTSYDRMICGFYNSVSSGDVNGFFLKTNSSGQICFGNGTSSATYLATGSTTLSASTRYIAHITYSTSTGYTVIVENGSDGSVVETLTASTTAITTAPYLVFGCNVAAGSTNYNWNGLIELASYYITVDGTTAYFAVPFTGTVSLPSSWKTLDGVVYEYPNGFPETQGKDLTVGDVLVGNYNNLYVTRTGESCGMAISSTSPTGVDSSAILGTVFIGGSRDILKYTPNE